MKGNPPIVEEQHNNEQHSGITVANIDSRTRASLVV